MAEAARTLVFMEALAEMAELEVVEMLDNPALGNPARLTRVAVAVVAHVLLAQA